jgi:hypothetical protein
MFWSTRWTLWLEVGHTEVIRSASGCCDPVNSPRRRSGAHHVTSMTGPATEHLRCHPYKAPS